MNKIQRLLKLALFICGAFNASLVNAEACTYNEALMAFQQGNIVRGQALITMAAKDGDQRAIALFAALQETLRDTGSYSGNEVIQLAEQEHAEAIANY
ncbi:MAG: hypothetical protein AMJ53_09145 [Gammaproteobacteria bacterium SG8_11]|nr:MAG: hypothetical protein AMJ53_09145 [Gammaproteobacteria bacterium SG8_11]